MADLSTHIETDAQKAQSVTVDGQTIVRRSIKEQIEADQYLAAKTAAASGNQFFGLRMRKIVPPGGG
jgi:hypothetical protein